MHLKVIQFSSSLHLAVYVTSKRHKIQLPHYLYICVGHIKPGTFRVNLSLIALYISAYILYSFNDRAYGEVGFFYIITLRIRL